MTDEKKKPEEDEVSDEQLEGVAGGATTPTTQPITRTKQQDLDTPDLVNFVCDKTIPTAELLDPFARTDDED